LREQPEGRVLERPVYLPETQLGSVYVYYTLQAPPERPLGYSTAAPSEGDRVARTLRGDRVPPGLGIRFVVEYRDGRPDVLTSP
jgi:hypothetical protein